MTSDPPTELGQVLLGGQKLAIARAQRSDVRGVVTLLADDVLGRERELDPDHQSYRDAFTAIDADPHQLLLVVRTSRNQLVATAQITFIPGLSRGGATRAQVEAVRVAASHRGAGLGEAVFTWIVEYCTARGARLLELTTDRRRADAARFYERLGFVSSHHGLKLALN